MRGLDYIILTKIYDENITYKFKKNLILNIEKGGDEIGDFIKVEDKSIGISCISEGIDELLANIKFNLRFLHLRYIKVPEEQLSERDKKFRNNLLKTIQFSSN